MLRQMFIELAESWENYRAIGTTNKNHRVHKLIIDHIPEVLQSWISEKNSYIVKGSDGQGNILRTPWVATFNTSVTTSATKGFYPVYLFKDDLKEVVLQVGFGATQFKEKYGSGKTFFTELELAVRGMQASSTHLLDVLHPKIRALVSTNMTNLTSGKDFSLRAYERCSIYSVAYSLKSLPTEDVLRFDYLEILKLYDAMVNSVLLPNEEEFVIEKSKTPDVPIDYSFEEFIPGMRKVRKHETVEKLANQKRYSKSSDKVGRIGEEYVFEGERNLLRRAGREDLADKVILHREYAQDRTPGWDITSYHNDGSIKYIEVKSSVSKAINSVTLTSNEWKKANKFKGTSKYYLYLVTEVLHKTPKVQVMSDPASYVDRGILEISVDNYLLYLGKSMAIDEKNKDAFKDSKHTSE